MQGVAEMELEGGICIIWELNETKQVPVLVYDYRKIIRGLQVFRENGMR